MMNYSFWGGNIGGGLKATPYSQFGGSQSSAGVSAYSNQAPVQNKAVAAMGPVKTDKGFFPLFDPDTRNTAKQSAESRVVNRQPEPEYDQVGQSIRAYEGYSNTLNRDLDRQYNRDNSADAIRRSRDQFAMMQEMSLKDAQESRTRQLNSGRDNAQAQAFYDDRYNAQVQQKFNNQQTIASRQAEERNNYAQRAYEGAQRNADRNTQLEQTRTSAYSNMFSSLGSPKNNSSLGQYW